MTGNEVLSILVSALIGALFSILVGKLYNDRPILVPYLKYAGIYPTLIVENYGKSVSRQVRVAVRIDGILIMNERVNLIEPGYKKGWFIRNRIGNGEFSRRDLSQYELAKFGKVMEIKIHQRGFRSVFPSKYNFKTEDECNDSLLDSAMKENGFM